MKKVVTCPVCRKNFRIAGHALPRHFDPELLPCSGSRTAIPGRQELPRYPGDKVISIPTELLASPRFPASAVRAWFVSGA
jgi:hypothetical protein